MGGQHDGGWLVSVPGSIWRIARRGGDVQPHADGNEYATACRLGYDPASICRHAASLARSDETWPLGNFRYQPRVRPIFSFLAF